MASTMLIMFISALVSLSLAEGKQEKVLVGVAFSILFASVMHITC